MLGDDWGPELLAAMAYVIQERPMVQHEKLASIAELWPTIPNTQILTSLEGAQVLQINPVPTSASMWEVATRLARLLGAADIWEECLQSVSFFAYRPPGVKALAKNSLIWSLPVSQLSSLALTPAMVEVEMGES